MRRDHETLRTAGEALYGANWQSDLARALDVAIRTVQRWASGAFDVPESAWPDIAALCRSRGKALAKMAERLERDES